jgi:hypothetical protein
MSHTALSRNDADHCSSNSKRTKRMAIKTLVDSNDKNKSFGKRFSIALRKATAVRKRYLGRRLTENEFSNLKKAVRKQCEPTRSRRSSIDSRISRIEDQLKDLTLTNSKSEASSGVENLLNSISILRQQVNGLFSQLDEIQVKSCRHPKVKTLPNWTEPKPFITFSVQENDYITTLVKDFKPLTPGSQLQLCCNDCLVRRIDYVFSKIGFDLTNHTITLGLTANGGTCLFEKFEFLRPNNFWTFIFLQLENES